MKNLCRHSRTGTQLLCHQGPTPYALSAFPSVKIHGHRMAAGVQTIASQPQAQSLLSSRKGKRDRPLLSEESKKNIFYLVTLQHNCEGEKK